MTDQKKEPTKNTSQPVFDIMPHDENVESAVLCILIVFNSDGNRVNDIKDEYFYSPRNKKIFQYIKRLHNDGMIIDPITLWDKIKSGKDDTKEMALYLNEVQDYCVTDGNYEYHLKILREKYYARELMNTLSAAAHGVSMGVGAEDIAATIMDGILDLYKQNTDNNILNMTQAIKKVNDAVDEQLSEDNAAVKTWFGDLDRLLGPIRNRTLTILGGRPSMGKSVLAMCIILNNIINGNPCGLINYEMTTEETMFRMLSNVARQPYMSVLSTLTPTEEDKADKFMRSLMDAENVIQRLPLYQEDCPRGDLANLLSLMTKMVKVYGCKVIFIDHLSLVSSPGHKDNKTQEIGEITKTLKRFAKEHNVRVVCVSQLNRLVETRKDKHPIMADLRESGNIEQDADVVIFVYREEYYNPQTPKHGIMEVGVAKNRNGATGWVELYYEKECSFIASLTRSTEKEEQ